MGARREAEERAGPEGARAAKRPRAPRPDLCRRYARKELAAGLPEILRCFIAEAQKGSIPHMKALTGLAGLDREGVVAPLPTRRGRRARSLSEMLLRELRRPAAVATGERPTVDTDVEAGS